jgi:hypothetical protein
MKSWNSSHGSRGRSQDQLKATGGISSRIERPRRLKLAAAGALTVASQSLSADR